jgi:hypothetical protein
MAAVTLADKFPTAEIFLAYAEQASGMDFDDQAVIDWFNGNQDFVLTYTGIMKVLNQFVIPTVEEPPVEEPTV